VTPLRIALDGNSCYDVEMEDEEIWFEWGPETYRLPRRLALTVRLLREKGKPVTSEKIINYLVDHGCHAPPRWMREMFRVKIKGQKVRVQFVESVPPDSWRYVEYKKRERERHHADGNVDLSEFLK
jgi:hypothetical protein